MTWRLNSGEPAPWYPKRLLTPQQAKALATIRRVTMEAGTPPTLRELSKELGYSRTRAKQLIDRLVHLGYVVREHKLARALSVATGWIHSNDRPMMPMIYALPKKGDQS